MGVVEEIRVGLNRHPSGTQSPPFEMVKRIFPKEVDLLASSKTSYSVPTETRGIDPSVGRVDRHSLSLEIAQKRMPEVDGVTAIPFGPSKPSEVCSWGLR